jgi:type IV pilus assembly protein PilW
MLRRFKSGQWRSGQRGYSLVELMIALLIALFLLGGLVTLVMGTRRSNGTQSALSQLQDNERIAMTLISNVVQNAGYFPYPTTTDGGQQLSSFPAETFAGVGFIGSQVVGGTYSATAPGDTFGIRFFAPASDTTGTIINCAGQSNTVSPPATNLWYTNVFSVAMVNGTWWLQCQVRPNNNGAPQAVTGPVNLIPNVTNISVLYGVGSVAGAAASDFSVVQYLNASQVTNWLNVTCVKVTLTFLLPQYGTVGGQMMAVGSANSTTTFQRVIPVMARVGVNVI